MQSIIFPSFLHINGLSSPVPFLGLLHLFDYPDSKVIHAAPHHSASHTTSGMSGPPPQPQEGPYHNPLGALPQIIIIDLSSSNHTTLYDSLNQVHTRYVDSNNDSSTNAYNSRQTVDMNHPPSPPFRPDHQWFTPGPSQSPQPNPPGLSHRKYQDCARSRDAYSQT